jgi:hypothetical protein
VGGIPHVFTKYENYVLQKTKKTTKLMKHLGGSGKMDYIEWLHRSHLYAGRVYLTWRTATQEQRDWRRSSHEASSATTSHMGSVLTN